LISLISDPIYPDFSLRNQPNFNTSPVPASLPSIISFAVLAEETVDAVVGPRVRFDCELAKDLEECRS